MRMYMVTVESGALCEVYHVKAKNLFNARVDSQRKFYVQFPDREITHVWAVAKDKA